jgi:transposase
LLWLNCTRALKLNVYGYLNRIGSSGRLERAAQRNVELMWLMRHLVPDFKTIADFRRDNGAAILAACRQFVMLCRGLGLFSKVMAAIDGSKFKAVNNRDCNYTTAKVEKRIEQAALDAMQTRFDQLPDAMALRRQPVEHVFSTLKAWGGSTPFLSRTLETVRTELRLAILAYNMKRVIKLLGLAPVLQAIRA